MSDLVALPLVIPLLGAAGALVAWRSSHLQRWISVVASAALAVASLALLAHVSAHGIVVTQVGAWPTPYGISLVADLLACSMLAAASLLGLIVTIYSLGAIDARRTAFGFHPLLQLVLAGSAGAFLTGDLFNLFVWIEVQLIASFVLMALGGERAQLEGAIKYVTLNLVASALLLAAVGLLYGMTGTLGFAAMSARLAAAPVHGPLSAAALLLLCAFGIKAALFPFFFWLPASYHTPPAAVSALFSGLLTKVGVYAMIRVSIVVFGADIAFDREVLLTVAALTMITGVLGAAAQTDVRRILSFHIVSQIGYMVMGLGLATTIGVGGAIFFVVHNIFAKSALFLVAGVIERARGTGELARLGGLARGSPLLAALFLVPALSLAGIPPFAGFFGKLVLVRAAIEQDAWALTIAALVVSLLTLYSMTKIWLQAFWAPLPEGAAAEPIEARTPRTMLMPLAAIVIMNLALTVFAQPALELSFRAAAEILDRRAYVATVVRAAEASMGSDER
ncbi:MAG: Na+/H+ antiporter subunit D [Myxococcota bacterium]|nr:Na+/H+ antiporter subunit D [Myxococcota bacterium]